MQQHKKNDLKEASLAMALVDTLPVILFSIGTFIIGISFRNPVFFIGAILCILAGTGKVLYKMILALKKKSIPWLSHQLRILMPSGFLLMLVSILLSYKKIPFGYITSSVLAFPGNALFGTGLVLMCIMMIFALKADSSSKKINWIEQSVNTVAQFSFLLGILLICYSLQYYKVTYEAEAYLESTDTVFVSKENGYLLFDGPGTETAIIFYPGALVEYTAYAPILHKLSQAGIDCFLVDMPYHMSIFGTNKADKIIKQYSYNHWYMAGHSLGGYSASSYVKKHMDEMDGLILLASYPSGNLNENSTALKVISIYGSNDSVLNKERFEKGRLHMPTDYTESCIKGGNHAGFGSYGAQAGDSPADITPSEQWNATVEEILKVIPVTLR